MTCVRRELTPLFVNSKEKEETAREDKEKEEEEGKVCYRISDLINESK